MIELWWSEAREHNVLPLDDRGRERFIDPTRPAASEVRDVYRYYPNTSPVPNVSLPTFLNCPHSFTARFTLNTSDDEGLIVSQGGNLGGWAFFVQDGVATYANNYLRLSTAAVSTSALPIGRACEVRFEWAPIEAGLGDVTLFVDGEQVARHEAMKSAPMGYSMVQEGLQIGRSWGTDVASEFFTGAFAFTGDLAVVEMRTDQSAQIAAFPPARK